MHNVCSPPLNLKFSKTCIDRKVLSFGPTEKCWLDHACPDSLKAKILLHDSTFLVTSCSFSSASVSQIVQHLIVDLFCSCSRIIGTHMYLPNVVKMHKYATPHKR